MADLRCPESLRDRPCALYRGPRRPVSRSLTAAGPIAPSTELALETTQEIVWAQGLRRITGASDCDRSLTRWSPLHRLAFLVSSLGAWRRTTRGTRKGR